MIEDLAVVPVDVEPLLFKVGDLIVGVGRLTVLMRANAFVVMRPNAIARYPSFRQIAGRG